jgi:CHAD domain-containing protein
MSEKTNFLYKAFKKKADSLLSNLEHSSAQIQTSQIHQIRLDIKRIRAIFQLVEILKPEEFSQEHDGLFLKTLFKTAGKIRDIQVNLLNLGQLTGNSDMILPFKEYLLREERNFKRSFKYTTNRFNQSHLSEISQKISQIEKDIPVEQIIEKANAFINTATVTIRKLNTGQTSIDSMHKIRQQLKSLSGVAALIATKNRDEKLKNLINVVKNTDFKLGQWHDHVTLTTSLDSFLELTEKDSGEIALQLQLLVEKMKKENKHWAHALKPTVQSTIQEIRLFK